MTFAQQLQSAGFTAEVIDGQSTVGGGSLPGETLPTKLVALDRANPDDFLARLRRGDPPVVARIENDRVVFDLRTVMDQSALLAGSSSTGMNTYLLTWNPAKWPWPNLAMHSRTQAPPVIIVSAGVAGAIVKSSKAIGCSCCGRVWSRAASWDPVGRYRRCLTIGIGMKRNERRGNARGASKLILMSCSMPIVNRSCRVRN